MAKEKAPASGAASTSEAPSAFLTLGPRTLAGYEVVEVTLAGGKLVSKRIAGPYPLAAAGEKLRMEVVTRARAAK